MCGGLGSILESATDAADKVVPAAINVGAPIVGGAVGGPAGAAIGSGFSTLAQGGDLTDAAKAGGLSYAGGQLAGGFGGGSGGGFDNPFALQAAEEAAATAPGAASFYNPFALQAGEEAAGSAPGAASSFNPLALQASEEAGATSPGSFAGGFGVPGGASSPSATIEPFGAVSTDAAAATPTGGFTGSSSGLSMDTGLSSAADDEAKRRAAAAAKPAASTASPSVLQSIISGAKKNPLAAAGLAANVIQQIRGGGGVAKQLNAIGKPASDLSQSLLSQYQSGQLNTSTAFDINRWEQEQLSAARSYYARAGMGSSSAAQKRMADITAQANAMRDQARQGILTSGLNAAQIAQGPMQNAIIAQANSDKALSDNMGKALQALMLIQAAGKPGAQPAAQPAAGG